jgi:predicted Zn-dependent protease
MSHKKWTWQHKFIWPGLAFALTFTACVTTPETGRKQLAPLPESTMNSLGAQAYEEMLKTEKKSTDAKLTAEVLEIGKRIAAASGKNYNWEFTLFENKQVNAFCLPGGKVGVYTGIIPVAKTNAGLAAVLGHEVAHAVLRHSGERASQMLLAQGILVGADLFTRDSKSRKIILTALGLGIQGAVLLPYSRSHESEADTVGLKYMAKAGYDPDAAAELWKRMAKLGGNPPELLSTHPDPSRRSEALRKEVKEVMPYYEKSAKIPTKDL